MFLNCDRMDEVNGIFDCFTHLSINKSFTPGNNIVLLVNLAFFKIFVARQKNWSSNRTMNISMSKLKLAIILH